RARVLEAGQRERQRLARKLPDGAPQRLIAVSLDPRLLGRRRGADPGARAPVPVRLSIDLDGRPPESVEVAAYYVVCESLANVGKHARASLTTVDIQHDGDALVVEVVDDGVGGADSERGTGLRGLADRVEALGGRLRVWTPPG